MARHVPGRRGRRSPRVAAENRSGDGGPRTASRYPACAVVLTLATFVESTAAFANVQAAYSGVIGVSLHGLSILKLSVMFSLEMSCLCHFFPKISNSCHLSAPKNGTLLLSASETPRPR